MRSAYLGCPTPPLGGGGGVGPAASAHVARRPSEARPTPPPPVPPPPPEQLATDCGALNDAVIHHKRYKSAVDAVTAAVESGVDSNCGKLFGLALPWAVGNGTRVQKAAYPA